MAQEPGPEHELRGLLDQRSLAEDPPVIRLARLVPEYFQSTSLRMSAYVGQLVRMWSASCVVLLSDLFSVTENYITPPLSITWGSLYPSSLKAFVNFFC